VQRASTLRGSVGRVAAAALALGALSALTLAPSTATAATRSTTARVISTVKNPKLGTILVAGNTVYALKPSRTACTAKCLRVWPPVLLPRGVMLATAGAGVDASKLGTVAAAHGALQVTYSGKRLYWFAKDKAHGQVHGNVKDKWGKWSTVVTAQESSSTNTTNATATTSGPATTVPPVPQTVAPETPAPQTAAPQTAPPTTSPPPPPPTNPPMTQPPPTTSPSNGGIAF
jgi:predicted lipoprotein with Yx(FWY)xxD motif